MKAQPAPAGLQTPVPLLLRPRLAVRHLIDTDDNVVHLGIALLWGLTLGSPFGAPGLLAGPVLALAAVQLEAWLHTFCGVMLGGEAEFGDVRRALAWSTGPLVLNLPVHVFGTMFPSLAIAAGAVHTLLLVFSAVFYVVSLSAALDFSLKRAIATALLSVSLTWAVLAVAGFLLLLTVGGPALKDIASRLFAV